MSFTVNHFSHHTGKLGTHKVSIPSIISDDYNHADATAIPHKEMQGKNWTQIHNNLLLLYVVRSINPSSRPAGADRWDGCIDGCFCMFVLHRCGLHNKSHKLRVGI